MTRIMPHPAMSIGLFLSWLVLNQSLSLGHILLGATLGIVLGRLFDRLHPPRFKVRNKRLLLLLLGRVAWDILRSNLTVAAIILGGRWRRVTSGFVQIPLELTDRYALAVLACIITAAPGTVWVRYDPVEGVLLIHVFDLVDESVWVRTIDERYQRPLLEIFG